MTAPFKSNEDLWWVYFVQCSDNSLYTGITTDLTRRVRQHNGELVGGARYTKARRPVRLCYFQSASSRSQASQMEHQMKKLKRKTKLAMIDEFGQTLLTTV